MTTACYVQVSTVDQNLDRQIESTTNYAQDEPDADLPNIDTYRDKSTGTDTERSGYKLLMADVKEGDVDADIHRHGDSTLRSWCMWVSTFEYRIARR